MEKNGREIIILILSFYIYTPKLWIYKGFSNQPARQYDQH